MFKLILKNSLAAAALAVSSMASAAPVTVGGVTWDPDSAFDFSAFSVLIFQSISALDGTLSGYGIVQNVNGALVNCGTPTCEMTFQFSGYTPLTSGALPTTLGQAIGYTGGVFNVYVDPTGEINSSIPTSMTAANTGDGTLWLALTGHAVGGNTLTGTVQPSTLTGAGLLDVVGGAAAAYLNTNTKFDGADIAFTSSFTLFPNPPSLLTAFGTGNLAGDSAVPKVPAPIVPALLGFGLLGLAALRRK
jgi:hypothetical protein